MDITTDGLVIKETPINDSDKLLTVLTGGFGKITVLAKGVKGIRSKNASAVQIFCYSGFELLKKDERYLLKAAQLKESFYGIRDHMPAFALSAYVVDVLSAICAENANENEIFRLALNTLYALSKTGEKPLFQIKGAFELRVVSAAGFMPDLNGCGSCAAEAIDHDGIKDVFLNESKKLSLYILEGALLCNRCRAFEEYSSDEAQVVTLSEPVYSAMRYILRAPQNKYLAFRISGEFAHEFGNACERFLLSQMERDFETLEFYKKVCGEEQTRKG